MNKWTEKSEVSDGLKDIMNEIYVNEDERNDYTNYESADQHRFISIFPECSFFALTEW